MPNITVAQLVGRGITGRVELVYYEEFSDARSARQRENFLKSGQGRQWLDQKIQVPVTEKH